MFIMKHFLSLIILILFALQLVSAEVVHPAEENKKEAPPVTGAIVNKQVSIQGVDFSKIDGRRIKIVTNIVKNALETYHYKNMTIDKNITDKVFDQFFKKMDYGKEFFLKSDISNLSQFKKNIPEELNSGDLKLLQESIKILEKRVRVLDDYRKEFFSKKVDFTQKDSIEVDAEKRDFLTTEDELKNHWRKMFKYSTLVKYASLIDEQENPDKEISVKGRKKLPPPKKKTPPAKKMSKEEMMTKAMDHVSKKYERLFSRFLQNQYDDYLEIYLSAITTIYDPHTSYMPPKRKEDFDIDISGSLEGIGAVLQEDGSFIKVVNIIPGGAAWRGRDLEVDDLILMVAQKNGEFVDLEGMRVDDAVRYIRGKRGTQVRLLIKKVDGTRKTISITRDVVEIEESLAKASVIEHKNLGVRIGYIHLPKFYRDFGNANAKNCTQDVKFEIERLKKAKMDGMILDLRDNGGGSLEDARQMAGLFFKDGPVVQVRDRDGKVEVLADTDKSISYDAPLIVMINRYSASASEILAGALQDYKRAVIVGGNFSHGKGTVQAVLNLNQGPLMGLFGDLGMGALKVTLQKFYRITGASTQYKGVSSDIILPDPYSYAKNRESDLDYSLPWDEIKPLSYSLWNGMQFDLEALNKKSLERVSKNKRMQRMSKSIEYLTKKRDETIVSINLQDFQKQDEENKKMSKELKLDEESKDVKVSHIELSVSESSKTKKKDAKKWAEDLKRRHDDWIKLLRSDVLLEEAMFIMNDMIDMEKKSKK